MTRGRTLSMSRRQDGMALIVVLWLVVLLSIMAAGHSRNVHTDSTLAARQVQAAKARALAEAGINHVISAFESVTTTSSSRSAMRPGWSISTAPARSCWTLR
jgi:type II secretory pathway component PulK